MNPLARSLFKLILLTSLQFVLVNSATSGTVRIASLNLCTDQLVLVLADSEQIASVTFLSQHSTSSYMAAEAANHHINYGQVEELIPIRPDLVVTLTYSSPATLRLLQHLGFKVELFIPAKNIGEVEANMRRMAKLLGQETRAESLIRSMQERFQALTSTLDRSRIPRGILYEPNGYTAGVKTLRGDLIRLAGWHNIASEAGIESVGVVGLEALVLARPERLILSPYAPGTSSLGHRVLNHPALNKVTSHPTPLIVPAKYWMCGGPMNADAVTRLIEGR
ncbi:MAG: ABC transporter substrate-binding protein [Arenicellales bacterium]|nr:ABC transporter substrate-binding protein [Arenicellales bacterium]